MPVNILKEVRINRILISYILVGVFFIHLFVGFLSVIGDFLVCLFSFFKHTRIGVNDISTHRNWNFKY